MDFGADDGRALFQGEDVTDEGFGLAVDFYDVGDLDDGVFFGLGEFALAGRTFNIEGHDAEWGYLGVLSFAWETLNSIKIVHIEFYLTRTHFLHAFPY